MSVDVGSWCRCLVEIGMQPGTLETCGSGRDRLSRSRAPCARHDVLTLVRPWPRGREVSSAVCAAHGETVLSGPSAWPYHRSAGSRVDGLARGPARRPKRAAKETSGVAGNAHKGRASEVEGGNSDSAGRARHREVELPDEIAVCGNKGRMPVTKRIEPQTSARSLGEGSNPFDTQASRGLADKGARRRGRGVMSPWGRNGPSTRCAGLRWGGTRILVSESGGGLDLVATRGGGGRARARRCPRSSSSDSREETMKGRPRGAWPRLRGLVSQVAELEIAEEAPGQRQTEFGYDVIEAPLPAVVAVSDAINEPRYPSLKGIMGAKKKPQETVSAGDLGLEAATLGEAGSGTSVLALNDPPARGDALKIEDDAATPRRSKIPRRTELRDRGLLEPRGRVAEGVARRHRQAAQLETRSRLSYSSGVKDLQPSGAVRGSEGVRADDPTSRAAPQPRVDMAHLVRERESIPCVAASCYRPTLRGLAARPKRPHWVSSTSPGRRNIVGKRHASGTQSTSRGWTGEPASHVRPARSIPRDWGEADVSEALRNQELSTRQHNDEQALPRAGPVVEDAEDSRRRERAREP